MASDLCAAAKWVRTPKTFEVCTEQGFYRKQSNMSNTHVIKNTRRSFAIANIRGGWALVPFGTREALTRDDKGRFTGKVEEDFVLPAILFRVPAGGTLADACEKLAFLVRHADSCAVFLNCKRSYVTEPVRDALGNREVLEVTYIPADEIESMSSVMGLAFKLAQLANNDNVCPQGMHAYSQATVQPAIDKILKGGR